MVFVSNGVGRSEAGKAYRSISFIASNVLLLPVKYLWPCRVRLCLCAWVHDVWVMTIRVSGLQAFSWAETATCGYYYSGVRLKSGSWCANSTVWSVSRVLTGWSGDHPTLGPVDGMEGIFPARRWRAFRPFPAFRDSSEEESVFLSGPPDAEDSGYSINTRFRRDRLVLLINHRYDDYSLFPSHHLYWLLFFLVSCFHFFASLL
jgi:hypothetical protein